MYEHDNNVVTTNKAFYTQADYQISDTVYVTLGVRYSEDDRTALEARGGHFAAVGTAEWVPAVLAGVSGDDRYLAEGMTPLAALNVAQGAATFTGDI